MSDVIERIKDLNRVHNLVAVNFLDADGGFAHETGKDCATVELLFANDEAFSVPIAEYTEAFEDFEFNVGLVEH